MLKRSDIKKIIKNVDSVSRATLLKKANILGIEDGKSLSNDKLKNKIRNVGEKQIDVIMTNKIKEQNQNKRISIHKARFKVNAQGVSIKNDDFNKLQDLQNKYNAKKERSLNNLIAKYKKNGVELSQVEIDFLKGKSVRHVNSSENIELNVNFRKENLIDSISHGVDVNYYLRMLNEEFKNFNVGAVVQNRSRKLNSYLKNWRNSLDLSDSQVKEIQDLYTNMNIIEKSQFNKDLERKMAMVESVTTSFKSGYDTYNALKELVFNQKDRNFITN